MRKSLLLLTLGMASPQLHAAHFDLPDLSYEYELHRQFLSGGADNPTLLAPDATIENYAIQKGETLWSLSRILYGDGGYWPKVWAQNNGITNPHLVRPGHQLQFLLGSEDDAPAFRFSEDAADAGLERTSASTSNAPVIEIPPPEIPPRPVLKIPASFPEWQSVFRQQTEVGLDDSALSRARAHIVERAYLRAWVEEKDVDPVGFYMENDTETGLPVVNQYVFIKIKKGKGAVGQKLLIVHSAGKIRKVQDNFDNERAAYLIQVAGELQITEMMSNDSLKRRDKEEFDCYRAVMTKTTGLSVKGNALIPGQIEFVNLSAEGPPGHAEMQIIGSERHTNSVLYGQGDLVFLNKGNMDGVAVGQVFDVFGNRTSRYPDTPVTFSPSPQGRLKIVKVTENFATGLMLNAHESILQGDKAQPRRARATEIEEPTPDVELKEEDLPAPDELSGE